MPPFIKFYIFKQDGLLSSEYKHGNYEVFMEKRNLYDVKCAAFSSCMGRWNLMLDTSPLTRLYFMNACH